MDCLRFYLIGHPLGHSMSPFIHERLFGLHHIPGSYALRQIAPERLEEELPSLWSAQGFNVTIPHKCAIIPYLHELSPKAALYGAVNTVKCGEVLKGYNTDCEGFLRALDAANLPLKGKVLICGAGGVARMAAFESALHGCAVTIATRESSALRAGELKKELCQKVPGVSVATCLLPQVEGTFDLLVNGTPAGMFPNTGEMAVTREVLARCSGVFDTIYNPQKTRMVCEAQALGVPASGGLAMLVCQAAAAQEIWLPVHFTAELLQQVIAATGEELERQFGGRV